MPEGSLRVRYTEWPPWAMDVPVPNGTVLNGVLKDVFGALSDSLRYKFLVQTQSDHLFGALQADGNYSGMLGALARKEVDIGGPFVASDQRAAVVDFTNCLEFSRLGIITGIESADRNMFLYFKVFSWQVWLMLLVGVVSCALVSILIYDVWTNGWTSLDKQPLLLSKYCWIFWSYLIGHDGGTTQHWAVREVWYRQSFRILLSAWLLGPVIISLYTFQGTITSTFAITKLRPVIADLDQLTANKNVVPVITRGSAVEICFRTSRDHAHIFERMRNNSIRFSAASVSDTMRKVEAGSHVLIVDYAYALSIASDWVRRRGGRCSVQVEELLFCQNFIALALRKGFDARQKKKINSQLTYIVQAKLTDRWMNRVLNNYTHCTRQPSEGSKALGARDIAGGFVLWAVGSAAAAILLTAEVLVVNRGAPKPEAAKSQQEEDVDP